MGANKKRLVVVKCGLVFLNIVLVLSAVAASVIYSDKLEKRQSETNLNSFISTIESMKQIANERYDGKGYPDALKGEDIPISAQLVSLADVYDALVSERCYKKAYSKEQTFHMIINGECGAFSPKLIETFKSVREEFEKFADNPICE